MKTLLRIDSSPRTTISISRQLGDHLQNHITNKEEFILQNRDLYYDDLVKLGNEDQVTAYYTPEDQQTQVQKDAVASSNTLALEFAAADIYLFTVPMYNFTVSAGLKTYIDMISRAGISFQYTENGPIGLLKNKKAYIVITTGGTPAGSASDFVTPYLTQFLHFVGITDVTFINSDLVMANQDKAIANAKEEISTL